MLKEKCHVNTNIDSDTFVGVQVQGNDITINFPLGYSMAHDADDDALREDVLLLLDVLMQYTDKKESSGNFVVDNVVQCNSPLAAYIFVIKDFVLRGYYKECVIEYSSNRRGKINWNRTIKKQKPLVQDADIIYLDFITKKTMVNENDLITMIHQYCVYTSFVRVGWLFTNYKPGKPVLQFNKTWFATALRSKLASTFNDANKSLFLNLLKIVEAEPDDGVKGELVKFGTHNFEYVWEHMIDAVYGIADKETYYPHTRWQLMGAEKAYQSSALEPDTIMLYKNNIYVLDAKYYKFGYTKHAGDLPSSSSINKQITYAEYIDRQKHLRRNSDSIYNAFIMPFSKLFWQIENNKLYIGDAVSDWKSGDKSYEQIKGILLDTKHLMQCATSHSSCEIAAMANIISETINLHQ